MHISRLGCLVVGASLLAGPAYAASDLVVSISASNNVLVYDSGRFDIDVSNIGNKNAKNVVVTVALPTTNTSPTVHILGTVDGMHRRCSLSGTVITCNLGRVKKNKTKSVWYDISLAQSAEPIVTTVDVTTTSNENSVANNSATDTAVLLNYAVAVNGPVDAHVRHCSGQGLHSFLACVNSPSSISSHDITLEGNNTITISGQPAFTGMWSQPSPDRLQYHYSTNNVIVAEFDGYGVDADCFEGRTTFPQNPPWIAMYEVCLQ